MNSKLMNFDFKSNKVRVLSLKNEPWFVAKDVALVLGYKDPSMMLKHVDDEDKQTINPQKLDSVELTESFGANTFKVSVINESGLYACIFGSEKPEAKVFKKWVTSEVLPEIRKTGLYNPLPFRLSDNSALVSFEGEDYWVTTTKIAEIFEKRHDNVLTDFTKAIEDLTNLLNSQEIKKFKLREVTYTDDKNRTQKALKVNRPLFNFVALSYKGNVAKVYRSKFILAFEELERQVKVYLTQQLVFKDPKRQQVYILKNLMTEYIKIGVTNNIDRRRAQLETASGCDIEVVFLAPLADNSRCVEQELHEEFKDYRLRGEWFNLDSHKVILALREKDLVIYPNLPILGGNE